MFPDISFRRDAQRIFVALRSANVCERKNAELIIDVSRCGNWIRGFEMVGGMFDFALKRATEPFRPGKPLTSPRGAFSITYDFDADAAYFNLPYGRRFYSLSKDSQIKHAEFSHCISPIAECSLDMQGGLISVDFSVSDAIGSIEEFLYLLDYNIV
jgi:uncharacterized protein YuzE